MIHFELFTLDIIASNINWIKKTITINKNIEYIKITIKHYNKKQFKDLKNEKIDNDMSENNFNIKSYRWVDIVNYWLKNINIYNNYFNIKFDKLDINIDYCLAPLFIASNNLIIGIFIYNKMKIESNLQINNNKPITNNKSNTNVLSNIDFKTYGSLSIIKPSNNINKINENKLNLFNGLINYENSKNKFNEFNEEKISLADDKYNIPLKWILLNSRNYLPKLEIIKKDNILQFTKIFQNLPNP